jgi:hypothetical protein
MTIYTPIDKTPMNFLPRENYYKLKVVDLNMNYFDEQWDIINGNNDK